VSIRILEAGILDTIQDLGRFGHADSGINSNGAMDTIAATIANYLTGNDANEAVIEMHYPASVIQFNTPALIAITGADFSPLINDQPVPVNTPILVPANAVLRFTKIKQGARTYLAIKGGFNIPQWLGSYSTNLKAKAGGYNGRALQKGDELTLNTCLSFQQDVRSLPWHADLTQFYKAANEIRIIKGSEHHFITECSATILAGNTFTVSHQSDRMGFRLNGSPLQQKEHPPIISAAVTKGTVQLLPSGQLIILMADHQTTGGYPKIAHVISADIPSLAQTPVNTALRFQLTTIEEAESLLFQQYHHLQQLKNACTFRLQQFLQQHAIN
jgi:antagonist of KipI